MYWFSVYYITHILLFSEADHGPLRSKTQRLQIVDTENRQLKSRPVHLFDWFRRLFGAYVIERNAERELIWRPKHIAVWICPICLSFWIACVLTVLVFIYFQNTDLYQMFFWVLSGAGFTSLVERFARES